MELTLNDKNLRGELPALELGTLDGLRTLNMENNPSLTAMLTPQLAKLPLLQSLFLSRTGISGTLPTEFGSRLAELQLSSTVLTGTLPTELGLMERLRDLNLSHNRFTGTIPMELMVARDLETLDLSSNRLTGSFPVSFSQSTTLDVLNLSENTGLVGPYPDPPSSLLTIINFAGTSLTGSVPNEYCSLVYLESLLVDCDGTNGTAPCRCCQCDDSE
jgi:Leucine-rich repeat (LRR) protein